MKKLISLFVVLLAVASVNATVTSSSTRPGDDGGLTIDNGLEPLQATGMNVQRVGTQFGKAGTEFDVINQNFRLSSNISLAAFAIQLTGTGKTDNIHISTSNTVASRDPYVKMKVKVWRYTGASEDLVKYYAEPSNQNAGEVNFVSPTTGLNIPVNGTTPITHWEKLGEVSDWPHPANQLDTHESAYPQPLFGTADDGWLKFDLSSLGLNLTAGTQYAISLNWEYTMGSSQGIRLAYSYPTTGQQPRQHDGDPGFMFGRSKSLSPWDPGDQYAPLGGYTGPGINPDTGLWEDTFGKFGDGTRYSYSNSTGLGSQFNFVVVAVPEPATIALLSLGGLLLRRRSK